MAGRPWVRVERIGREGQPVAIVDGFVSDPGDWVEAARQAAFAERGAFYPGVRAAVPADYFPAVAPVVAALVREVFDCHAHLSFQRALFSVATTPAQRLSLPQRIPHVDSAETGRLAIIHYLSDDPAGTGFYRHRGTGFETVDGTRQEAYRQALMRDFAVHGEPPPAYIGGDTAIFERVAGFGARFNRALLYRSNALHCADIVGDPGIGGARLTIASFLTAR